MDGGEGGGGALKIKYRMRMEVYSYLKGESTFNG